MQLKPYQADTLAILRRFFEEARIAGPRNAYEAITREPEQAARLGSYAGAYAPLNQMPDVPYVCLRLPTGGGKTLLAAHAVAVARNAWTEKDYPLVLWLVPSNTRSIPQDFYDALKAGKLSRYDEFDETRTDSSRWKGIYLGNAAKQPTASNASTVT